MTLRMAPLIDVVFLLLVFFLLTANFRSQEGFLPAELPGQATMPIDEVELEPLEILIDTAADGTCRIYIGRTREVTIPPDEKAGFAAFSIAVLDAIEAQGRHLDDPVKLSPTPTVKWDHLIKAYDALWEAGAKRIVFKF